MSPALAGKTHRDLFVPCCCLLSVVVVVCENRLTFGSNFHMLWWMGHRCNMGTLICWWGQRLHIKVKGHLRSNCKIGGKCESGLIWKVEVLLEPNMVNWYIIWPFVCSCGHRSYTKVKGNQRSHCKMGPKCKIHLIWKVEVRLELNLVYW